MKKKEFNKLYLGKLYEWYYSNSWFKRLLIDIINIDKIRIIIGNSYWDGWIDSIKYHKEKSTQY